MSIVRLGAARLFAVIVLAIAVRAHAETTQADPAIPDASLHAVRNLPVRFEGDGTIVEGRLLAFDNDTVTIARATTNEVVTLPRAGLSRVILADGVPAPAPARRRIVGVQMSLLGTLAVDADYGRLRGFASTSLLLPVVTASGSNTWWAGAIGGGVTFPLGDSRRWRVDAFAQVMPLRMTSWYTYVGFGLGAGVHYTAPSGFTFGATLPVVGWATRLGSSPYGYDASFRYNDSLGYYYFAGVTGMPLLTMGYRFASCR